ncbi:hypothetical protein N0V85_003700 [Neurospora sp. IMI 360204]|nr:hypothetical protein N0V85_003700 [Neurospora sp. IMI 360204]
MTQSQPPVGELRYYQDEYEEKKTKHMEQFAKVCDILIAFPSRLIESMERLELTTLRRVRYMVIDHADDH